MYMLSRMKVNFGWFSKYIAEISLFFQREELKYSVWLSVFNYYLIITLYILTSLIIHKLTMFIIVT